MKILSTAKVTFKLGISNVIRIIIYRVLLKLKLHKVQKLTASPVDGNFFKAPETTLNESKYSYHDWNSGLRYFSCHNEGLTSEDIPRWHRNFITGRIFDKTDSDWWNITDFDEDLGDIKTIWELSRFDWLIGFGQAVKSGDQKSLQTLNNWLSDWYHNNPAYKGINWKCGQEASIRVMHLATAALLLNQVKQPEPALASLLSLHLKRIAPTMSYAIAQNNNHGTSEAAALFIGGSWLKSLGDANGDSWLALGRKWLENRAEQLIEADGSFSQYSINYHRLMLDTYSLAELWRREFELEPFSDQLTTKIISATNWLYQFTNPENGDTPNLGANDGALLLPLSNTDFRDCRPSVQLASTLFSAKAAYTGEGCWNEPLFWLELPVPDESLSKQESCQFDNGGYVVLNRGSAKAVLRYPRFKFRPGQSDALHLDFWIGRDNYLRDAGTFSYSESPETMTYYADVEGHNTIQFDDRNQMPRLGRFLLGEWLKTDKITPLESDDTSTSCLAGYTDSHGASHVRKVILTEDILHVQDKVEGFEQKAVLRWRLKPGDWVVDGFTVSDNHLQITMESNVPIKRFELVKGYESRCYLKKTPVPIVEIEISEPAIIKTICRYK